MTRGPMLLIGLLVACLCGVCFGQGHRRWHKTSLTFDGPSTSETAHDNPYLNYRLDVEFTCPDGSRTFTVPGFYAGDGNGGAAGNKWRVRFMPDTTGRWSYHAKFEHGENVAVAQSFGTGTPTAFNGTTGNFTVNPSDKSGRDFRSPGKGLIKNRGDHYLTFGGSGKTWVKGGTNIPENLLSYDDFDNTPDASHSYPNHASDWNAGDPTFHGTGANHGEIIGAINYISSTGANCVYFLPMNLGGDGKDTYPFVDGNQAGNTRYDQSKLRQWEQLFTYAQAQGVFLHFQLAETESANETFFDDGELGPQRKLFYRELIARFGHHPGLEWDIGEENDFGNEKRKAFAAFIKSVDPNDHPTTTHTRTNQFGNYYEDLLGNDDFDMTAFQANTGGLDFDQTQSAIEKWRRRSAEAGTPWVICVDEPQTIINRLAGSNGYTAARKKFLWSTYLDGGGGFEWYVKTANNRHSFDQNIEDFRALDKPLQWTGHALDFLERLPLKTMRSDDSLVRGEDTDFGGAQVLAKEGEVYAIYLPDASNDDNSNLKGEIESGEGGPPQLDLRDYEDTEFTLRWYNPRTGEFADPKRTLTGGDWESLGVSPDGFQSTTDWTLLITIPDPPPSPS